jgi:hypothetical protein
LNWIELQADYFESFDSADTDTADPKTIERVYGNVWLPDNDEIWSTSITSGVYRLRNDVDQSAVRYKYLRIAERNMGESPVSVEIRVNAADTTSGAGLIYRFDRDRRHYFAFVLATGGQWRFYARDASGFRILYSRRYPQVHSAGFDRVAMSGAGGKLELYVNDQRVQQVQDETLREGDTGIVGIGKGSFEFDNFTIYK